jgi:hypothetical protein
MVLAKVSKMRAIGIPIRFSGSFSSSNWRGTIWNFFRLSAVIGKMLEPVEGHIDDETFTIML